MTYQDLLQDSGSLPVSRAAPRQTARVVLRSTANPNHHLWNNRGTWWCHFTIHRPDYTAQRIRVSLRTRDLETARARRDELFDAVRTNVDLSVVDLSVVDLSVADRS